MQEHPVLPADVSDVVDELIAGINDDLAAILWQGSWARGESTAESDHDLVIILRRIDDDVLARLHAAFQGRDGWSSYVKSEAELATYPLAGRTQFHFGCHLVYGEFVPPPLTRESVLEEVRSLIVTVNHEMRYRIVHGAARSYAGFDAEWVRGRNVRWVYHMAKALLLALKVREYVISGTYPVTRAVLRAAVTDPLEIEIIDEVERWSEAKARYANDITDIALKIDAAARGLTEWLRDQS